MDNAYMCEKYIPQTIIDFNNIVVLNVVGRDEKYLIHHEILPSGMYHRHPKHDVTLDFGANYNEQFLPIWLNWRYSGVFKLLKFNFSTPPIMKGTLFEKSRREHFDNVICNLINFQYYAAVLEDQDFINAIIDNLVQFVKYNDGFKLPMVGMMYAMLRMPDGVGLRRLVTNMCAWGNPYEVLSVEAGDDIIEIAKFAANECKLARKEEWKDGIPEDINLCDYHCHGKVEQ
ncbi:MAG: hypothetical protein M1834_001792 [Cirrosporium novae-zelandiae]|nr:MAG: hypothetical protein M1834_001792 [Cirrosporium novae-zelandiae]